VAQSKLSYYNMNNKLEGKNVAILVTDGFEQSEFTEPRAVLKELAVRTHTVSPTSEVIKSWDGDHFGETVSVDLRLQDADVADYDALLLPGGVINTGKLRILPEALKFVRDFFEAGKPIAAIGHGPQVLIDAGVVRGRRLTSHPSIKTDLINAGAEWVDEKVVADQGLVTGQRAADIPDFIKKMVEKFSSGNV